MRATLIAFLLLSLWVASSTIGQLVGPSIDLMLPPPISDSDLDRFAKTLRLSDTERELVEAFLDDYKAVVAVEKPSLSELKWLAGTVLAREEATEWPSRAYAAAYANLMKERSAVAGRLMEAEESFFADDIAILLDDERLGLMRLIRVQRLAEWAAEIRASMPGVTPDVADMIRHVADRVLPDTSEMDVLLIGYYDRLGPALRSRLLGAIEVGVKDREILAATFFEEDDQPRVLTSDERVTAELAMFEARRRLFRRQAKRDARVRTLHEKLLFDALRFLPRFEGRNLELAVLSRIVTEPGVYPDTTALDDLFAKLNESEDFTPDQIETFSGIYDNYLRNWRAVDREVRRIYREWIEEAAAQRAYHVDDRADYMDELNDHLSKRAAVNKRYRDRLTNLLSDAQRQQFGLLADARPDR